jgi:hypothetical protein
VTRDTADVLRERLGETEMPFGSLVSKDYRMAALLVVFDVPTQQDFDAMQAMVTNVDATLAKFPVPEGLSVGGQRPSRAPRRHRAGFGTGPGPADAAGWSSVSDHAGAGVPQHIRKPCCPLFAVGQGLIWTFGAMAAWSQPLNIVSNILPCLLLINGVSNSIHVLTRYCGRGRASRRQPQGRQPPHDPADARGVPRRVRDGGPAGSTCCGQPARPVLQSFGAQAAMGLSFLYLTVISDARRAAYRSSSRRPSRIPAPGWLSRAGWPRWEAG